MTLQQRAAAYAAAFPKFPAAWPRVVQERKHDVLYATWVLGNDYRTRSTYYGAYPHGYLPRVEALFPDLVAGEAVLHVFSGSMPASSRYLRLDANAELQPDVVGSVYDAARLFGQQFQLVLADPPYSAADAEKYGTPMVNRGKALRSLAQVTQAGGFLVWLDVCWPMHRKDQWTTVGRILLQRSTNHRARVVSIFERVR